MRLAAVIYEPGSAEVIDAMFRAVAAQLQADGVKLAGAVQHNTECTGTACSSMILEEITTGRRFDITAPRSPVDSGCSLDPAALEDAAGFVAATLASGIELAVVNRFGKQEVLGNGFRSVIELAVAGEIAVLTALCETHRASWQAFTGSAGVELPAAADAILDWCRGWRQDARWLLPDEVEAT